MGLDLMGLISNWNMLLSNPFSFNDINFDVNYVYPAFYSPTYIHSPHYHPWYEFVYNESGTMYTSFDDKEFFIEPNTSYLVPPGQIHSHRNNGVQCNGLCFRFNISAINSTKNFDSVNNILSVPRPFTFDSELDKIQIGGNLLKTQAEFILWLMRMCDKWDKTKPEDIPTTNLVSPQVILFLQKYYKQRFSVNDIAVALNISYRTLSRKFKEETGITISEKLEQIRINEARRLLLETNKSMFQIAEEIGYENEFYFSRVFKKHEYLSPTVYRSYRKILKINN